MGQVRVGLDISALDSSFKAHALRGIGRYVRELAKRLPIDAGTDVQVGTFDHRTLTRGTLVDRAIDKLPLGRHTVRQQLLYPWRLGGPALKRFDVVHFPAHMDAPSWGRKPYILTVLDLIPVVLEHLYRPQQPSWRFRLARWLELEAIRRADLILAISETTAQDVVRVLEIPRERIRVTPLGIDSRFFDPPRSVEQDLLAKFGLRPNAPLILYVGGIDPRKNWNFMLRTLAAVRQQRNEVQKPEPQLLLAGNVQNDREFPALSKLIKDLGLESEVFLPGFIPDDELAALARKATMFFFPSLYEGFGLPPLEAMAMGLPVVSSCTSSLPEVLGSAALFFEPQSTAQAVQALTEVLDSSALRDSMRERGLAQARKFTWDRTAQLTLDAYAEMCP